MLSVTLVLVILRCQKWRFIELSRVQQEYPRRNREI